MLVQLELCLTAYVAYRSKKLQTPKKLIEEIDTTNEAPPRCPASKLKMYVRIRDSRVQQNISGISSGVKVGTSPAMKTEGTSFVPKSSSFVVNRNMAGYSSVLPSLTAIHTTSSILPSNLQQQMPPLTTSTPTQSPNMSLRRRDSRFIGNSPNTPPSTQMAQLVQTTTGRHIILTPSSSGTTTVVTQSGQRLTVVKNATGMQSQQQQQRNGTPPNRLIKVSSATALTNQQSLPQHQQVAEALARQFKSQAFASSSSGAVTTTTTTDLNNKADNYDTDMSEFLVAEREQRRKERRIQKLQLVSRTNQRRCEATPIYGSDLRDTMINLCALCADSTDLSTAPWSVRSYATCQHIQLKRDIWSLTEAIKSFDQRTNEMRAIFNNFVIYVPAVSAPDPYLHISHPHPSTLAAEVRRNELIRIEMSPRMTLLHPIISAMNTQVSWLFIFFFGLSVFTEVDKIQYTHLKINFNKHIKWLKFLQWC